MSDIGILSLEPRIYEIGPPSLRSGPGVVRVVEAEPVAELLERLLWYMPKGRHMDLEEQAGALLTALRGNK